VLDRPGLEASCCECYAVVKREFDRLLPDTLASADLPGSNPALSVPAYR
jgi:hypothetical protein